MDYVAEVLTEEKKAIAGWNHYSGEEKEVKPLNSGSSVVVRLLLTVWGERERITTKKGGNRILKYLVWEYWE